MKNNKSRYRIVLLACCAVLLVLCCGLLLAFIQTNNHLHKVEMEYEKIKEVYQKDKEQFTKEIDKIRKENEKLKEENNKSVKNDDNSKTIYLTFDDGPSPNTEKVLNILKQKNVKATFFVIGSSYKQFYKKIVDSKNAIGVHTYSHNYLQVYANINSYIADFTKMKNIVLKNTGVNAKILRLPGGSSNSYVTSTVLKEIQQYLRSNNLTYFDWNCSSGDASIHVASVNKIIKNATSCTKLKKINLLMHDGYGHENTVKALPAIIDFYKKKGYSFNIIDKNATVIKHR